MANNIINAVFGSGICAVTTSAYRANYGMVLRFSGIDLPTAFECDFSNYDTSNRDSITAIGQNGEVQIPDNLWDSGLNIYAYVYLHPTDDSGVTVYTVTIPVLGRPNRTEETPTPHEQSVIEQAISALNDAVEQTAADVVAADASASAAAQSEANAATSERSASASAGAALASQNAAESAAQHVDEQIDVAAGYAENAALSASQAAESATSAQESAEQAEQSAQSISGDVERAERAATTATDKATEAGQSATAAAASASAALASQNAAHASETASAQSAQSAASSAQNAASSAQSSESSATDAEQAKTDAQDAQAAAEQAAQSVSGLSAQIVQNTADIADLVQSKAGVLVDTATGSIASFVPDATVPTVKGLIVDIEPVQDLHGYDSPWPAGGGKNLLDPNRFVEGKYIAANGTLLNGATNVAYEEFLLLKSGSTYTVSCNEKMYNIGVCIYQADKSTVISRANNYNVSAFTINSADSDRYVRFWFDQDGSTTMTIALLNAKQPMFEIGNERTSYAPYSNICPISGRDSVEVQRTGKNLFPSESYWKTGTISPATGEELRDNNYWRTDFIDVESGAQYRLSFDGSVLSASEFRMFTYKEDGTFIDAYSPNVNNVLVFSGATKIRFRWLKSYNLTNFQLELGSTATAYEPYQGDTYTLPLGQTVYGGKLNVTNGVLTVTWKGKTLNGTETWAGTPGSGWYTSADDMAKLTSYDGHMIADRFPTGWRIEGYLTGYVDTNHSYPSENWIYYINTTFTSNRQVKDYFANNPTFVVYTLATPITISLTPLEISVLTGQTNNVWADSGDVSVDYAADLKTYINNKIAAAVAALS